MFSYDNFESRATNKTAGVEIKIDVDHPACTATQVLRGQKGTFDVEEVRDRLSSVLPDALVPKGPGLSVAAKRAMQDLQKRLNRVDGRGANKLVTKGRKSGAVYSLLHVNKERCDRELDDGTGVGNVRISARVEMNGVNQYSLRVDPLTHEEADFIRERFHYWTTTFKNSEDLSTWIGQKLMPYVGALPTGQGAYYLPKGSGFELLQKIRAVFTDINDAQNFVRVRMLPVFSSCTDTLEAMADALRDAHEKSVTNISKILDEHDAGANVVGTRRFNSLLDEAASLRKMYKAFGKIGVEIGGEAEACVTDLEAHIGIAQSTL
jgi:hypothetical protein